MMNEQRLVTLSLSLYEQTIKAQGIVFCSESPEKLAFDCNLDSINFPDLDTSDTSSNFIGLIYEAPELLADLTSLLELLSNPNQLGVFSKSDEDSVHLYVLKPISYNPESQVSSKSAKIKIFRYSNSEFFKDENKCNYYIKSIKLSKRNFIKISQKKKLDCIRVVENKKEDEEMYLFLQRRSRNIVQELEIARMAFQQVVYQIENKESQLQKFRELDLMCITCRANRKEIAFSPCGHVCICKSCLSSGIRSLSEIVTNTKTLVCYQCKAKVDENIQLYY